MNGGKSRSEIILSGDKSRPQSNTWRYRLEGSDSQALEVKKYKGRFPYLCFLDEVGAYYTDRIAVEATQVRSLNFALILMAQDQERIPSAISFCRSFLTSSLSLIRACIRCTSAM